MSGFTKTAMPGLVKNEITGLVMNTDLTGYYALVAKRRKAVEDKSLREEIDQLKEAVRTLQSELTILKGFDR